MLTSRLAALPVWVRSRLLVVAAVVVTGVAVAVAVGTPGRMSADASVEFGARLLLLGGAVLCMVVSLRVRRGGPRPVAFVVAAGRFRATTSTWAAWSTAGLIQLNGAFVVTVQRLDGARLIDRAMTWSLLAMLAGLTVVVALIAAGTWRLSGVDLTVSGVVSTTPLLHRSIPWNALAHGGPLPPPPAAAHLPLCTVDPASVRQHGWAIAMGTRTAPLLPLDLSMEPAFLANAIRWYAEHPEHRAAIGTTAEHQRLITTLNGR